MKLFLKLALTNIRRYPLRTLGSVVCLLLFSFALFSAVMFKSSLSKVVSDVLRSRSSGNVLLIKTDIGELSSISKHPDILEALPYYRGVIASNFEIEDMISVEYTNFMIEESPAPETLIPKTYLEEFHSIGGDEFLIAGRMPESPGEMLVCETLLKEYRIKDPGVITGKHIVFSCHRVYEENGKPAIERDLLFDNVIVGVFSEKLLQINALSGWNGTDLHLGYMITTDCRYNFIEAYCSIDKIDKAYEDFCKIYGDDKVTKSTLSNRAIEMLSNLNMFIGNLMYLASGVLAAIYILARIVSTSNYFKEKSLFITAADAFGCGKARLLGAFAAENITLLIPISVISAALGNAFVKMIFSILSAYTGAEFEAVVNLGIVFIALALMLVVEFLVLMMSLLLFRKKVNN